MDAPSFLAPRDRFVGREGELSTLESWFDEGVSLATVVGFAGAGKTRLAVELAARLGERGEARFVDLTAARTADDVLEALARSVGAALVGSKEADLDVLGDALASLGRALLILDNFEQVASASPETLTPLLARAPSAFFLVTSREALAIAGETRLALEPLGADDAAALFEARAAEVRPGYAVSDDDRPVVAALVDRLDRIPLAIELAAARAGVLAPSEIAARLEESTAFLKTRRRDVPDRQATLRAAIEWSLALLDRHERDALAQCTVFAGGFTVAAAEAIVRLADDGPPVLDVLSSLRDKSLLFSRAGATAEAPARLHLYVAVAELAAERLEDRAAAHARHAEHFARAASRWLSDWRRDREGSGSRRIHDELDDLKLAHRRSLTSAPERAADIALALVGPLELSGPFSLELALLEEARDACRAAHPRLAAHLGVAAAVALGTRGRTERATRGLADARAILEDGGADETLATRIAAAEGRIALTRIPPDAETATRALEAAAEGARRAGDRWAEAHDLGALGLAEAAAGRNDAAIARLEEAARVAHAEGFWRVEARVANNLGIVRQLAGDLEGAVEAFASAQAIAEALGDRFFEGVALQSLTLAALEAGDLDRAARHLESAAKLHRRQGEDARYLGHLHATTAMVRAAIGDLDAAERALDEARRAFGREGLGEGAALTTIARGFLARARGEAEALVEAHLARARAEAGFDLSLRVAAGALERTLRGGTPGLEIEGGARAFRLPGADRVELGKKRVLRQVLSALVDARLDAPGTALTLRDLRAAGWPDEKMSERSAARRVYVAIGSLRKLGLGDAIVTHEDGYLIDPQLPVRRV